MNYAIIHYALNKRISLGGGTVYTAVLEAVPERVASSNLARGTNFYLGSVSST